MRTKPLVAAVIAAVATTHAGAEYVYSNVSGDLKTRLNAGTFEIADEIILGGTGRELTDFDFQYYGLTFSGNEQARVRFYLNDGAAYNGDPNARRPLTMFYDSGYFPVNATARSVLHFSTSGGSLTNGLSYLPERFTFSIQFSGIDPGESAGVDLYNAPTVGNNFNDYWINDGGWRLQTNATMPLNFGASFQAVPEPSTWMLGIVGGLTGVILLRRRRS